MIRHKKIGIIAKNNSSAFILAAATIALFLLNVLLKTTIDASEYGKIALLLTYITLLSSFGLFGSEQLLIRQAKVNQEKKVTISSVTIILIGTCVILQLIFPLLYHYLYQFNSLLLGVILSLSVTLNMLTYNIFRISGRLNLSQLNNAAWKITALCVITILISFPSFRSYNYIEIIVVIVQVIFSIVFLLLCNGKLNIRKTRITKQQLSKEIGFIFFFFISLLSASFIAQGDRLLIPEVTEDLAYIGEYLFLGTIIIFPYNFLQSYLGFKYVSDFKVTKKPIELLKRKVKEVTFISALYTPIILVGLLILTYLNIVDSDFFYEHVFVVVLMFIIGIVRMFYSIFSSLMGTRGSLKKIKTSNLYSIASILVGISVFLFYPNVNNLVIIFTFLWVIRSVIWYFSSTKDFYEES